MVMTTRHLHRDYHTAECGKDASHILMTYDEAEADCAACEKAKVARVAAEAEGAARVEAAAAEAQAAAEEEQRAKDAEIEERVLAKLEARLALSGHGSGNRPH